jgi:glycosyltransferase involved in cell wall biosynthesis
MTSQKDAPTISVITATYNRADFIASSIESVLGQTFGDLEYLIMDDGSTDATEAVVEPYLRDPRLSFRKQQNKGQAAACSAALEFARGEFVCFLDSDNRWKLDKLERQLPIMRSHPNVHVLYGDQEVIDENDNILPADQHKRMKRYSGRILSTLLRDNHVSFNTAMVRRTSLNAVGGFNSQLRAAPDYDLWLRLAARYEFLHVPEIYGQYRIMTNQMSSDKERRFKSNYDTLQRFFAAHPGVVSATEERHVWSHFYWRRARTRALAGRRKDAFGDYLTALRLHPSSPGPWRGFVRLLLP